jgi:major histocompatibility complex class I
MCLYDSLSLVDLQKLFVPGVVAQAFNPSIWEAEAGEFMSSRPAWSTE